MKQRCLVPQIHHIKSSRITPDIQEEDQSVDNIRAEEEVRFPSWRAT